MTKWTEEETRRMRPWFQAALLLCALLFIANAVGFVMVLIR